MDNKKVYGKKLDKILANLITSFNYVPYKLNKHSEHEIGHTYWSGLLRRAFTVIGTHYEGFKLCWDNGQISVTYMPLDIKHDYELKPFETKFGIGIPVFNENHSYTAAEIKALIFSGIINDEEVIDVLFKNYFIATHIPNDYNYYFIRITEIDGEHKIQLKRDLEKCPHNFYNIKTLEDLFKDPRIALYDFIDKDGNGIIVCKDIPSSTPVLNIEHIAGAKYRITLDI